MTQNRFKLSIYFYWIGPLGRFGLVVAMSMCTFVCMSFIFGKASHWPSDHMIRFRPLIGLSEVRIFDENSEEVHNLQSHDGLLEKNAEEVYNLHHTCNLLMVSLRRTLKKSITCNEKNVPDSHQNSVSLIRTRP